MNYSLGKGGCEECVDCGMLLITTIENSRELFCNICDTGPRCSDCIDAHESKEPERMQWVIENDPLLEDF